MTAGLSPSSGRISVKFDNQDVINANEINLYRPYRTLLRNFNLGTQEIKQGNHRLTIEYIGSENENKNPEVLLDFF